MFKQSMPCSSEDVVHFGTAHSAGPGAPQSGFSRGLLPAPFYTGAEGGTAEYFPTRLNAKP